MSGKLFIFSAPSGAGKSTIVQHLMKQDLGLEFRFDAMINPRIDYSPKPLSLRLTPQEVVQLDLQDNKRAEEWIEFCQHFHGAFTNRPNKLYQCGGGISTFTINPAGMMGVCVLARSENYDIRKGIFAKAGTTFS